MKLSCRGSDYWGIIWVLSFLLGANSAAAQEPWKPDTTATALTLSETGPTVIFLFDSGGEAIERRTCSGPQKFFRNVVLAVRDTLRSLGVKRYVVVADTLTVRHMGRDTTLISPENFVCVHVVLVAPSKPMIFLDNAPEDLVVRLAVDYFLPQLYERRVARIWGCYNIRYDLSGVSPKVRKELMIDSLPHFVLLDSASIRNRIGVLFSIVRPLGGGTISRGDTFGWSPIGEDSVGLSVGNEFAGFGMTLAIRGSRLVGKMRYHQDVVPGLDATGMVVANRIRCP